MKNYVSIQSSMSIVVTAGLQHQDVTNKDAHVPDRLKIAPVWPKLKILIKKGTGVYPSFITEWNTVKALEANGVITIGKEVDAADEKTTAKATELKAELNAIKKAKNVKDITLEALTEE